MNKSALSLGVITAIATAVAHPASAQSGVTLYGLVDEGLRYTTHVNTGKGSSKSEFGLSEGPFNGPRWGLRMTEDLGGGNKAFALMENGFNTNTGKLDQQGQLFGRQLYVGISHPTYGVLKAGRQYGALYSMMATVDPITTGNLGPTDWNELFTGLRFDKTLDYSNKAGPLNVELQYSFGNTAGSTAIGRTIGASVWYASPVVTVGVAGQQSRDALNHKSQVALAGAKGTYGKIGLYGYYGHSTKDAGFSVGASGTTDPLANTSMTSNYSTVLGTGTQTAGRVDNLYVLAASYQLTSYLSVIGTWMMDTTQGIAGSNTGRTQTFYTTAIYSLSRRTDVYAEVDYNRLSGGAKTDVNSYLPTFGEANTQVGAMAGIRVRF